MDSTQTIRGFNGFKGDELKGYLSEIAGADDELLSMKSAYMLQCKGPRRKIRDVMVAAKSAGMNMVALRTLVADDRARRRQERRIDALEADDKADYDAMQEALGELADTPLGQAALRLVKGDGEQSLDNLGA